VQLRLNTPLTGGALELSGYLGGPFSDHSGGLILFEGDSLGHAQRLVARDPFLWRTSC
jgi:hypothetical protein